MERIEAVWQPVRINSPQRAGGGGRASSEFDRGTTAQRTKLKHIFVQVAVRDRADYVERRTNAASVSRNRQLHHRRRTIIDIAHLDLRRRRSGYSIDIQRGRVHGNSTRLR